MQINYCIAIYFFGPHDEKLMLQTLAVVTLHTFYLGKLDLLTVYQEQYFPVVLFIMLYKVVLNLSLCMKSLSVTIHNESHCGILLQ